MSNTNDYILRGGIEGRERLRLLSRVMRPTTLALLERVGVRPGMKCLDVGCGGGDVTLDIARLVGPQGHVIGCDFDAIAIDLAEREARKQGINHVSFQQADIRDFVYRDEFDLVYSRFLLTHLADTPRAVANMGAALRPGGVLVVEDIDFRGHFSHPESAALARYVDLYALAVRRRGGDPYIGPRLPELLAAAGIERVGMNVVQPAGFDREVKLVNPITLENIAEAVVAGGLATTDEVRQLIADLYSEARDPARVMSVARVIQAWGRRSLDGVHGGDRRASSP